MSTRKIPAGVDAYIAMFPPGTRDVLERVRRIIRRVLPRAVEVISYGMPAYEVDGHAVIYFAGWKAHYSLYPVSDRVLADARTGLASPGSRRAERSDPAMSGKGTIRFPLSEPVPAALLAAIVKARANEAAARATTPRRPTAGAARRPRTSGADAPDR